MMGWEVCIYNRGWQLHSRHLTLRRAQRAARRLWAERTICPMLFNRRSSIVTGWSMVP